MHTHAHTCTYVRTYVRMHTTIALTYNIRTCIHTHTHIHVYTHTHTHTHTLHACMHAWLNCIQVIAGVFEKFKEKKLNVVTSLRDAADAIYLTVGNTHTYVCTCTVPEAYITL